jgi:hypothetical protein
MPATDPRRTAPVSAGHVLAALALAAAAGVATSYVGGRAEEAWWHLATAGGAAALFLAPRLGIPGMRAFYEVGMLAWFALIAGATLLTGLGFVHVQGWHWGLTGVRLWYAQPQRAGGRDRGPADRQPGDGGAAQPPAGRRPAGGGPGGARVHGLAHGGRRARGVARRVGRGRAARAGAGGGRRRRRRRRLGGPAGVAGARAEPEPAAVVARLPPQPLGEGGLGVVIGPSLFAGGDEPGAGVRVQGAAREGRTAVLAHRGIAPPEGATALVGSIYARADAPTAFTLSLGSASSTCEARRSNGPAARRRRPRRRAPRR